jgi:hypothetical protein
LALAHEFADWADPADGIRTRLVHYGAVGEVLEADIARVLKHMQEEARCADEY